MPQVQGPARLAVLCPAGLSPGGGTGLPAGRRPQAPPPGRSEHHPKVQFSGFGAEMAIFRNSLCTMQIADAGLGIGPARIGRDRISGDSFLELSVAE